MAISELEMEQIEEARRVHNVTRRNVSEGVEDIVYEVYRVLDHGFIRVVDYMGNDASVVQAARVSYGHGTRKRRDDSGLINYLMRHRHTTPFEMAEIKLHIKLPIFVARQWIRHRTASVNEYSARYSILDREFYVPEGDRLATQSMTNRQGGEGELKDDESKHVLREIRGNAERNYAHYLDLLGEDEEGNRGDGNRKGLARELARINLGVNYYTQWYWKVNLHNLMRFLVLRADAHAQFEIRAYANVLVSILHRWVPLTAAAFQEHLLGGLHLSASAVRVLKDTLAGKAVSYEGSGMSKREWNELTTTFEIR